MRVIIVSVKIPPQWTVKCNTHV